MSSIKLSPKHGLNPMLDVCPICGKDNGSILLPGQINKTDDEAPHRAIVTNTPCDECKHHMELGVILIEVDSDLTTDPKNPWRTGRMAVVKEERAREVFGEKFGDARVAFVEKGILPEEL